MGKAIKIGNRNDILYRMKMMQRLVRHCPKDATFMLTYEIVQIDKDFMKKAEVFNQRLREWEQKQAQKDLKEKIEEEKKIKEKEENMGAI